MHTHIHAYTHTLSHTNAHTHTYIHTHVLTHICKHSKPRQYTVCVCMCVCECACMRVCTALSTHYMTSGCMGLIGTCCAISLVLTLALLRQTWSTFCRKWSWHNPTQFRLRSARCVGVVGARAYEAHPCLSSPCIRASLSVYQTVCQSIPSL